MLVTVLDLSVCRHETVTASPGRTISSVLSHRSVGHPIGVGAKSIFLGVTVTVTLASRRITVTGPLLKRFVDAAGVLLAA